MELTVSFDSVANLDLTYYYLNVNIYIVILCPNKINQSIESAKQCNMTRNVKKNVNLTTKPVDKKHKKWFNKECSQARRMHHKCKRTYDHNKSDDI